MTTYDPANIFAKILRKELPAKIVLENEYCLGFENIAPAAPIHLLFIPKGEYVSFQDFSTNAPAELIHHFFASISQFAKEKGYDEQGYRLITNHGQLGGQSVFHFHVHLLTGKQMTDF